MADLTEPHARMDNQYRPQDAIQKAVRSAAMTGGAGLLIAAVQASLSRENVGAFGVFTRFGSTTALFATVGGAYAFTATASANLREKEDHFNHMLGGAVAGAFVGLRKRSMVSVLGNSGALAVVLGAVQYTGGTLFGPQTTHPDEGHWPTKEEVRKRFRRPINETINEIGEGRGIYAPGYPERRKERLRQNYGIEVPDPYWKTS